MGELINWMLYALRLKCEVRTYQERKEMKVRRAKCLVWGKQFRRAAYKEYGDSDMEVEIAAIGKHGALVRISLADISDGASSIG